MLHIHNREKLLRIFFDDPIRDGIGYQLRELSRKATIAPLSTKKYLNLFIKEKLIIVKKHPSLKYPLYHANRDSHYFKFLKVQNILTRIQESGLLEFLDTSCMPSAIILFGSASRGEDIVGSDIDLFIASKEKKFDLTNFEKKIRRPISLFFDQKFNSLSNELKNNVVNGIILKGYLTVFNEK